MSQLNKTYAAVLTGAARAAAAGTRTSAVAIGSTVASHDGYVLSSLNHVNKERFYNLIQYGVKVLE